MGEIKPIRMPRTFFAACSIPLIFIAVIAIPFASACAQVTEQEPPPSAIWKFGNEDDGNGVHRLQFSHDGKLLAVRNRANIVSIFDVKTRKLLCEVDGYENNWVFTIDFSPDSKSFVTAAGSSEKVKIWDSQTGKLLSEIDSDAAAAYFNQAGTAINVLGESHVETYSWPGAQLTDQRKWKSGNETRVGMSRDGNIVVTFRSVNRQVYRTQIIDLQTKSKMQLDGPTDAPRTVDISPNRFWIAALYSDSKIWLWDLRDPHQKKFTLEKHSERVQSIAFSPDSRFLVSTGWDDRVIAWDLLTRQMIKQFDGHTENVMAAVFSPTDLSIASGASGASDTSTIVWDLKANLIAGPEPITPEYQNVWTALGSSTIESSLMATSQFINGGDPFLDLLEQQVIASISTGSLDETIELLNHSEWAVRDQATQELMALRDNADAELRLALSQTISPEVKFRISMILKKKIARPQTDIIDVRRWSRIIFALEQINSERSQAILQQIARTTLDLDITQDAKESFERNKQRRGTQ